MEYSFTEILIMILIGLLFVKEVVTDWIRQKFGLKPKNGNGAKEEIKKLGEYYNHELTEKLDKLHEKFDEHMIIERENQIYLKQVLEAITKQYDRRN